MEVLLQSILSSDINLKLSACERLQQKVKEQHADISVKVLSACVGLAKEANLKVVLASLDCIAMFIVGRKETFMALVNMTFDVLVPRLGDTKINVREKAKETLSLLVENYSQLQLVERMADCLNNRNNHVKTALLEILSKFGPNYEFTNVNTSSLCSKIAILLNDQQSTVRQAAVDALVSMKDSFAPVLMSILVDLKVKPLYIQKFESLGMHGSTLAGAGTTSIMSEMVEREGRGMDYAATTTTTASRRFRSSSSERRLSDDGFGGAMMPPPMGHEGRVAYPSPLRATTTGLGIASSDITATSNFELASFLDFIRGEKEALPLKISDERELLAMVDRIIVDLGNVDDWNKRIQALITLQSLAWGSLSEYANASQILRRLQDPISNQLSDLRSAICKETCKTLAILAYVLPQSFVTLIDCWWPKIARVLIIKIQVMSSAADRCVRCIVASCQDSRLMQLLLESCTSKNAHHRKFALEYLALAALSDADAQARKMARILFWLLSDFAFSKRFMVRLSEELDSTTQKHLQADEKKSADFDALSRLPRRMLQGNDRPSNEAGDNRVGVEEMIKKANDNTNDRGPEKVISATALIASLTAAKPSVSGQFQSQQPVTDFGDLDMTESTSFKSGRGLASGSRRLSLTGPMRVNINPSTTTLLPPSSTQSTVNNAMTINSNSNGNGNGNGSLSKPAGRRMSLATTSIQSSANSETPMNNEDVNLVDPCKIEGSSQPFSKATMNSEVKPLSSVSIITGSKKMDLEEELYGGDIPSNIDSSTSLSNLSRAGMMPGKENRRISMPANLAMASTLLAGPKRIIQPSTTTTTVTHSNNNDAHIPTYKQLASVGSEKSESNESTTTATANIPTTTNKAISINKELDDNKVKPTTTIVSTTTMNMENNLSIPMVLSIQSLHKMTEDSSWSIRLKALEDISKRIEKAFIAMESLPSNHIDLYLSAAWKCQDDIQQKVATEAMKIIKLLLDMFSERCDHKINVLILHAFQQLNDRRNIIRETANEILTLLREKFPPLIVTKALVQVMTEVPERTKTAVMQYLGVLLPSIKLTNKSGTTDSDDYDSEALSIFIELFQKIADVLSSTQSKPSITLTAAGKRILVILYNSCPIIMASEIIRMKFQQLSTVKTLLKSAITDLDSQLLQASKSLERPKTVTTKSSITAEVVTASPEKDPVVPSNDTAGVSTTKEPPVGRKQLTIIPNGDAVDDLYCEDLVDLLPSPSPASHGSEPNAFSSLQWPATPQEVIDPTPLPKTSTSMTTIKQSVSSSPSVVTGRVISPIKELEVNYRPQLGASTHQPMKATPASMVMTEVALESISESNSKGVSMTNPVIRSTITSSPDGQDQNGSGETNALNMIIPGTERTLQYVLEGLGTTATIPHRKEVHHLLKKLAKRGDGVYWFTYGHQLLEGILLAAKTMQRCGTLVNSSEEEVSYLSLYDIVVDDDGDDGDDDNDNLDVGVKIGTIG
eukprot:scaffold497_cov170-Ochromonas_danica.AAC.3